MRESHVVSHSAGCVVLRSAILRSLHIHETCVLHGILLRDQSTGALGDSYHDHSVILSPIPHKYWDSCYRLVVNTNAQRCSLAKVLKIIRESKLRLLHANATGASWNGDVSASFVVVDENADHGSADSVSQKLEIAKKKMEKNRVLSGSSVFGRHSELQRTFSTKLKQLAAFKSKCPEDRIRALTPEFSLPIRNSVIDLSHPKYGKTDVYSWLISGAETKRAGSRAALVMTDSEEWFMRCWLIPPEPIRRFEFKYEVVAKSEGVDRVVWPDSLNRYAPDVLNALSGDGLNFNIYHFEHHTLQRDDCQGVERCRVVVVADTSLATDRDSNENLKRSMLDTMKRALRDRSDAYGHGECVAIDDLNVSSLHALQTPVFVATNAKRQLEVKYLKMTLSLVQQLKARRLYPVNVEISNEPNLRREILRVLDACPMFISLHLPDEQNRFAKARPEGHQYAASSWVQFEEAIATATEERRSFRLRHNLVAAPLFDYMQKTEDVFDDDSFALKLNELLARVDAVIKGSDWRKTSERMAKSVNMDSLGLHNRDLDAWLSSQLVAGVRASSDPPVLDVVSRVGSSGAAPVT